MKIRFNDNDLIELDMTFTIGELRKMASGQFVDRGGKRYAICRECTKVIRVDKPLMGSLHLCV